MSNSRPPLLGITAYSGTGKTTLLQEVIPLLRQKGVKVAVIKHTHHDMDIDIPGKDSYKLRQAGADQTIVACDRRWAMMTETPTHEVSLTSLAEKIDPHLADLILVEGFKQEPLSKIMLFRDAVGKPFTGIVDPFVIALATDRNYDVDVPLLDINDPQAICQFIIGWLQHTQ